MKILLRMARIAGVIVFLGSSIASAYNQPAVNLSATTFVDGGAPPGLYYLNYFLFINGKTPLDGSGKVIPGDSKVNVTVQLNQIYWLTTVKFLGGNLGLDVLLPIVSPTAKGTFGPFPVTANTAGAGDLVVGPALQWNTMLGGPLFQRFEFDMVFPTGKYDKNKIINPGANLRTYDPYYSLVWFFAPKLETSWRLFYTVNGENDDYAFGKLKPGRMFHANYAVSYEISKQWRAGVEGYILRQLSEDEINGVKQTNSKERVSSFGPGIAYFGEGLTMMLTHPVEFGVRNRFKGNRTTLQMIHRF